MRGEGGAGLPCRVAVAGNRAWLTGDGLVVGCRDCPPSRSRSPVVGRIALTRTAVPSRIWRTLCPVSAASAVCHISIFVLWSLPVGLPSDRSRWIHSLAPLRVCLACIALLLEVAGAAVIGEVYPMRHRRRCVCLSCKFRHRGGGLACVCFCCGGIFVSVTSPARGVCRSRM